MKVFSNCTVVVEFETTTSYKEKCKWRKTITDNGGIISYILTKKASFFVVFNKKGSSVSFKLRQCSRYNIPVVSPKYVQQCVTKNRLLDTESYRLSDINSNHEFGKGKIQTALGERNRKHAKRKVVTVNLTSHPSWLYGDVNAPGFDEDAFELPKWALLINEESKKLQALEVHVSTRLDCKFKYRLYAQTALVENNKVVNKEDAIVWYFNTVSEVLSGYEQLHRHYTNKPTCMVTCEPGRIEVEGFGSPNLRMALGKLSLLNEDISPQVAALTSLIWKEALTEVDTLLETPMKYIQEKQIIEGKVVLAQLTNKLLSHHGDTDDSVKKLIDQFYEVLPHKEDYRSYNWTLREVIGKQDFCQLLSDIVAVSEATDWSSDATVIAKYRAMGCHIQYVDQSSNDSAEIYSLMEQKLSKDGGKIHGLYRVKRTVEEVNFPSDVGNIHLLSHASPCYNFLGLLSRGLLLPNMVTDKLGVSRTDVGNLGAGIYFSDNPRKSAQYSTENSQTGTRFLLLSDVALGQCCEMYQSDSNITAPPEGFDSVQGVLSTDDKPSTFMDNEFVIYNASQQCMKYVVEFSLPEDTVKEDEALLNDDILLQKDTDTANAGQPRTKPARVDIDISDLKNIPDPLAKVKAGLQGNKKEHIPLKSVHIRGKMMDMVVKVVVLQAYRNDNDTAIEAKYVFPLDDTAAVCGFEAFINGKHIIGEVKEKSKARKEYKEAVARGDGAYLMEEETPDVFSVSVGNLPPRSDVLIKITYISELQVQGEAITFNIPASVAPWLRDGALSQKTQATTNSVKVSDNKRCDVSLMVAIEMPFDIRKIHSPSHRIKRKKTATKAVVSLPKKSKFDDGFQLYVYLAEVHVPRMWVERHPTDKTQACMLTFYPEFETESVTEPDITVVLDMSNSMKGAAEEQAKKVALLAMDNLPTQCRFNIVVFGSTYRELFPSSQKYNNFSSQLAKQFIQEATSNLGSTELWEPLHATQILSSANVQSQSLFLISDGHVTQESSVLKAVKTTSQKIRVFALGVSSTVNHHLLRSISTISGGTYQHYNTDTKSQWQGKLLSQLEKACQPGLSNVHVDWHQTNEKATPPTQAPNHIPCLFNGCRQVVYGFVESCTQASLKAKIDGCEISTMVSTVDLNITSGTMLHQLTARAVITDYENGILDDDRVKHQVIKNEKKQYIIDLSKKHSIVTPYTSFVAIEDRQQDVVDVSIIPSIDDLIKKETVDILPYIDWDPGVEDKDEDPTASVREILKKGEIQENYSMVQAEEIYTGLSEFIEDMKSDRDTLDLMYDKLGKFYEQNHAEPIGNILAQIEEIRIGHQLKQLDVLATCDYDAYIKCELDLRKTLSSKQHLWKVLEWFDNRKWRNTNEDDLLQMCKAGYHAEGMEMESDGRARNQIDRIQINSSSRYWRKKRKMMEMKSNSDVNLTTEEVAGDLTLMADVEMPCLIPPVINVSDMDINILEKSLKEASEIPLPDDDDDDDDEFLDTALKEASSGWDTNGKGAEKYLQNLDSATAIFDPNPRTSSNAGTSGKQIATKAARKPKARASSNAGTCGRKQIATKAARKSAPSTGEINATHASSSSSSSIFDSEDDNNSDSDSTGGKNAMHARSRKSSSSSDSEEDNNDRDCDSESSSSAKALENRRSRMSDMDREKESTAFVEMSAKPLTGKGRGGKGIRSARGASSVSWRGKGGKGLGKGGCRRMSAFGLNRGSKGLGKGEGKQAECLKVLENVASNDILPSDNDALVIGTTAKSLSHHHAEMIPKLANSTSHIDHIFIPLDSDSEIELSESQPLFSDTSLQPSKTFQPFKLTKMNFPATKNILGNAARKNAPVAEHISIPSKCSESETDLDKHLNTVPVMEKNKHVKDDKDINKNKPEVFDVLLDYDEEEDYCENVENEIYTAEKFEPCLTPTQESAVTPSAIDLTLSKSYLQTAPSYNPNVPRYSLSASSYNPVTDRYIPVTPSYKPVAVRYSSVANRYSTGVQSYRPVAPSYCQLQVSPGYNPAAPNYSPTSPQYSPTSPNYSPTSPHYSPTSHQYIPASPHYSPTSAYYSSTSHYCEKAPEGSQHSPSDSLGFDSSTKQNLSTGYQHTRTSSKYYAPDFDQSMLSATANRMTRNDMLNSNKSNVAKIPSVYSYSTNSLSLNTIAEPGLSTESTIGREQSMNKQMVFPVSHITASEPLVCHQAGTNANTLDDSFYRKSAVPPERSDPFSQTYVEQMQSSGQTRGKQTGHAFDSTKQNHNDTDYTLPERSENPYSEESSMVNKSDLEIIGSPSRQSYLTHRQMKSRKLQYEYRSNQQLNRNKAKIFPRTRSRSPKTSRSRSARSRFPRRSRSRSPRRSRSRSSRSRFISRSRSRSPRRSRSRSARSRFPRRPRSGSSRRRSPRRSRSRFSRSRSISRSRSRSPRRSRNRSPRRSRIGFQKSRSKSNNRWLRIKSLRRSRSRSLRRTRSRSLSSRRRSLTRSISRSLTRSRSRSQRRLRSRSLKRSRSMSLTRSRNRYLTRSRSRSPRRSRNRSRRSLRNRSLTRSRNRSLRRSRSRARRRLRSRSLTRSRSSSLSKYGLNRKQNKTKQKDRNKDGSPESEMTRESNWKTLVEDDTTLKDVTNLLESKIPEQEAAEEQKDKDQDWVWSGVRTGIRVKNLFKQPQLSTLRTCLQTVEDLVPERLLQYFELSEQLCSLIGVKRSRIIQILTSQGVKSLGTKMEQNVYRVIATLLTLLVLVKQAWSRTFRRPLTLTAASHVTYKLQDSNLNINIDGNQVCLKNLACLINWLEKKEKELPPLYNSLELGKTRMHFVSKLVGIFDNI